MMNGRGYRNRSYEEMERWMDNKISFPAISRYQLVDSPIVLKAHIEGFQVRRMYIDEGSSSEVMYKHCFRNFSPIIKAKLKESRIPLCPQIEEAQGSTQEGRMTHPRIRALEPGVILRRKGKELAALEEIQEENIHRRRCVFLDSSGYDGNTLFHEGTSVEDLPIH
ncbi:hypothetical protein Tco_1464330 [Tanacetum coccineum]